MMYVSSSSLFCCRPITIDLAPSIIGACDGMNVTMMEMVMMTRTRFMYRVLPRHGCLILDSHLPQPTAICWLQSCWLGVGCRDASINRRANPNGWTDYTHGAAMMMMEVWWLWWCLQQLS